MKSHRHFRGGVFFCGPAGFLSRPPFSGIFAVLTGKFIAVIWPVRCFFCNFVTVFTGHSAYCTYNIVINYIKSRGYLYVTTDIV